MSGPSLKLRKHLDYYLGGVFLTILGPVNWFLRAIRPRGLGSTPQGSICVSKLLGGGSLVIAYPALLGLRRKYPHLEIRLVTTRSVAPFADLLGVFNSIHVIDDSSFVRAIVTAFAAWRACWRSDTFIDFEVHSRLSSVFCNLTFSRRRIGFYLETVRWRKLIFTHLVFFNRGAGSYHFYEQVIRVLGATPADLLECRTHLQARLPAPSATGQLARISVGHACSDLGRERMLKPEHWIKVFHRHVPPTHHPAEIVILGSVEDRESAEAIIAACGPTRPDLIIRHECGTADLPTSISLIASSRHFIGIDSSLLHFARILGLPTTSFWGPTSAETRLKPFDGASDEVFFRRVSCSPCIHVAEEPPCRGKNICIQSLFDQSVLEDSEHHRVTVWYPDERWSI